MDTLNALGVELVTERRASANALMATKEKHVRELHVLTIAVGTGPVSSSTT